MTSARRSRTCREPRRRRWRSRALPYAIVAAALVGVYLYDRPTLAALRAEHERLQRRFGELAARDPLLSEPPDAELALAVPLSYTQQLADQAADYLLEAVPLRLRNIRFSRRGDVSKKILVGDVTLGSWRLDVHIRELRGTIRAGRPRLRPVGEDRFGVVVPAFLEDGRAEATLRFAWDSSGVANVLCKDFAVRLAASASVASEPDELEGSVELRLDPADGSLNVAPTLGKQTLRAHAEPSDATWAALRRRLEEQDSFWRCGIGLAPDDVVTRLRELALGGFPVKLPEKTFRPLRVPTAFRLSLGAAAPVVLDVRPASLRLRPTLLWFATRAAVTPPEASELPPTLGRKGE